VPENSTLRRMTPLPGPFPPPAVAAIGDRLPPSLRKSAPLTTSRLEFLTSNRVYCVAKAKERLDFVANTDLSIGIMRAVAWYRENGYIAR